MMLGEATHGIIADPTIERTVGRANEVDEPGFARGGVGVDKAFAEGGHVTIRA
ncbi:hypothetical protein D9M69_711990 [compost metagenome]